METVDQLQKLGFSQYEAQAYVALLQESPRNGYELAKASGIPRANIYAVLQKLEESGAVMRLTTQEGTRYAPVPWEELLAKLKSRYHQSLEDASESLRQIASPRTFEPVLNLRGYEELLDQARVLIDQTEQHLLVSVWLDEAPALAEPMQRAADRGVQITTLCLRGCPEPCPACRGAVFRYPLEPVNDTRWLIVVSDENELLAGEVQPTNHPAEKPPAVAVRTRQPMMVNLTASYIQNSIALASILTGLGNRLFSELDPQSVAALNHLHPLHAQGPWLDFMRRLLHAEDRPAQA